MLRSQRGEIFCCASIERLWLSRKRLDEALYQSSQKIEKKRLILEFCECLLLRNGFNTNILHCMWDFNLKENSSMGIYDNFFVRGVYSYISRTPYFTLVKSPPKFSAYIRVYTAYFDQNIVNYEHPKKTFSANNCNVIISLVKKIYILFRICSNIINACFFPDMLNNNHLYHQVKFLYS